MGAGTVDPAHPLESNQAPDRAPQEAGGVPAVASAAAGTRSPLTLVSSAVAGHDLPRIAASVHEALAAPVAIAIPSLGEPVVWPVEAIGSAELAALRAHTAAVIGNRQLEPPDSIAAAVRVRIGAEVVGLVAVARGADGAGVSAEGRAWLEAGAAAAAVTALMRDAHEGGVGESRRALIEALRVGPPSDVEALIGHARRLGFDLSSGAVGVCARRGSEPAAGEGVTGGDAALIADVGQGRYCGLVPLASPPAESGVEAIVAELLKHGFEVAVSSPRRDPELLHETLRESELLLELAGAAQAGLAGQEDTYRLLIGVMLRDDEELRRLRQQTISPLSAYDAQHDTELLVTLRAFLLHDGSTTDTAEALDLHRHTVGYRLARVHEVSGLSPYESEGRERLSLGLKADHIIRAAERLSE